MKIIISLVLAAASVIATTSSEPLSKRAGPGPHWDVSIFIPHIATSFSLLFPSSYFPFSVSHQFFPCPVDFLIPSNLRALLFLSFSEISCAQPHNPIAHFSNPDLYEYVSVAIDIVPTCCGCAHPDNLIVCCRLSRLLLPFTFFNRGAFCLVFLTRSWLCTSGDAISLPTNSQTLSLSISLSLVRRRQGGTKSLESPGPSLRNLRQGSPTIARGHQRRHTFSFR